MKPARTHLDGGMNPLDLVDDALDLDTGGELDLDSGGELDMRATDIMIESAKFADSVNEPASTYEEMHANNLAELKTSFMQRAAADQQRFIEATDSEFWFCVCFRSREQKEAFLAAVKWPNIEPDDKYVHGEDIAKALNITLPPARFIPPGEKPNRDMVKLGIIGDRRK